MRTVSSREFPIAQTLQLLQANGEILVEGFRVKTDSLRYKVFRKSQVCAKCGLVGTFFLLQQNGTDSSHPSDRAHFNLYGRRNGALVMMSKDHILPSSRGGANRLSNLQTMCVTCNVSKGSALESVG